MDASHIAVLGGDCRARAQEGHFKLLASPSRNACRQLLSDSDSGGACSRKRFKHLGPLLPQLILLSGHIYWCRAVGWEAARESRRLGSSYKDDGSARGCNTERRMTEGEWQNRRAGARKGCSQKGLTCVNALLGDGAQMVAQHVGAHHAIGGQLGGSSAANGRGITERE